MSNTSGQSAIKISVQNLGHSSQVIGLNNHFILTDPNFSRRCFLWPRRSPVPDAAQLPALSAVCISHAHPDHLDIGSFKYIASNVPIIVPSGMAGALRHHITNPIIALDWWATFRLPTGVSITAVPAKHMGGRWLPWRYRTVCGYLLRYHNATVYFAGDTRMGTHFKEIGFSSQIDVALLPIGCMQNLSWVCRQHLTPQQAITAAEDLNAQATIPNHWGTFGFAQAPNQKDIETFEGAAIMHQLQDCCHVTPPGTTWTTIKGEQS